MTLDGIFTEGYKKLIGDLKDDQAKYLRVIAEARGMPVEWIEKAEGIFIPNNDFMYFLFGQGILQFDCYRNGQCIWDNALIFPVRGADDRVAITLTVLQLFFKKVDFFICLIQVLQRQSRMNT